MSRSRKLRRLNSSRRLLFSGVPVNRILCTLLSVLSRLKIRLPSDLTARHSALDLQPVCGTHVFDPRRRIGLPSAGYC